MPTIQSVIEIIEQAAPKGWQETWDNSGLQVGGVPGDRECTGMLVTLDPTEDSVREAVAMGANLIVSHHPLIFSGLKTISDDNATGRIVIEAIRHSITIYSAHTNMDSAPTGVNRRLADLLGLKQVKPLVPSEDDPEVGLGAVGELEEAVRAEDFLKRISEVTGNPCLKHSEIATETVRRVALLGGSGAGFIPEAIREAADLYLTADLKYHDFQRGEGKITLVDGGHYETEVQVLDAFCELISKKIANFAVRRQEKISNPVRYFLKR